MNTSSNKLRYRLPYFKRKWYFLYLKRLKPLLISQNQSSDIPIDVVIPVIKRDLVILPLVIDSIRKYIAHPVKEIFLVASNDSDIKNICNLKKCRYINENSVLPIIKRDIDYVVRGMDRSGWIFQQLLKLGMDRMCNQEHYLVVDADTIFIRHQVFKNKDKTIFNCSDEYHMPYFETFNNLLGYYPKFPLSFVSHHILFEKKKLDSLKRKIEKISNNNWYSTIIYNLDNLNISSFSEFETYGNFVIDNYKFTFDLEYWFNLSLTRNMIDDLDSLSVKYSQFYKTVSLHHHNTVQM
ncbi:MAG: DUF6492 family protein [Cyanobacteria bacterium P01_A01_bin.45]